MFPSRYERSYLARVADGPAPPDVVDVDLEGEATRRPVRDFLDLPAPARLVVRGTPGSGRTTLLRHIARTHGRRIPVLLPLRAYDRRAGLLDLIQEVAGPARPDGGRAGSLAAPACCCWTAWTRRLTRARVRRMAGRADRRPPPATTTSSPATGPARPGPGAGRRPGPHVVRRPVRLGVLPPGRRPELRESLMLAYA